MSWRLSHSAERDLEDIFDYSAATWGVAQARNYVQAIRSAVENVAEHPWRVRFVRVGSRAFLRLKVEQHMAYAEEAPGGPIIRRILHVAQDPLAGL